jgi:hypothetical protein
LSTHWTGAGVYTSFPKKEALEFCAGFRRSACIANAELAFGMCTSHYIHWKARTEKFFRVQYETKIPAVVVMNEEHQVAMPGVAGADFQAMKTVRVVSFYTLSLTSAGAVRARKLSSIGGDIFVTGTSDLTK